MNNNELTEEELDALLIVAFEKEVDVAALVEAVTLKSREVTARGGKSCQFLSLSPSPPTNRHG